jgi:DNA invertase Pin-like site-specific DNA recombinase
LKVCIYSRVSTGEQETKNQSIVLSDWAKQRGFEVVSIYQEEESAWKAGHQRELANSDNLSPESAKRDIIAFITEQ